MLYANLAASLAILRKEENPEQGVTPETALSQTDKACLLAGWQRWRLFFIELGDILMRYLRRVFRMDLIFQLPHAIASVFHIKYIWLFAELCGCGPAENIASVPL